jgi:hypothetical protein
MENRPDRDVIPIFEKTRCRVADGPARHEAHQRLKACFPHLLAEGKNLAAMIGVEQFSDSCTLAANGTYSSRE